MRRQGRRRAQTDLSAGAPVAGADAEAADAAARRLRASQYQRELAAYAACLSVSPFFTASSIVPTM